MSPFFGPGNHGAGWLGGFDPTRLLDQVTNAYTAYSLRRLRAAYSGSAIRVKRSSDNAEQDIGFVGNDLDTASLLTFVGAGTGYIKTWYDQSGNGKNLQAASFVAANAPYIVDSGSLVTGFGSKPAVKFNGANTFTSNNNFLKNAAGFPTSGDVGIVAYVQPTTDRPTGHVWSSSNSSAGYSSGYFYGHGWTGAAASNVLSMQNQPELIIQNLDMANDQRSLWQNGQNIYTDKAITDFTANANLYVGYDNASSFKDTLKALVSELIVYNRELSATERQQVFTSFNTAYSLNPLYIIADGDSLTHGSPTTALGTYMQHLHAGLTKSRVYQVWDSGVGGDKIETMDSQASGAGGIDSITYDNPSPQTLLIFWGGTNNIVTVETVATTFGRAVDYITNRAGGNYSTIAVVTTIPRADTATTTKIFQYNDLVRAGMEADGDLLTAGVDVLLDLQTLTQFDADGDYNDTNYYNADKIHLTSAGNSAVAAFFKTALGLP
jgi:hypothetical protein